MKKIFIWLVASLLFTMVGCVEGFHESGMTETSSEQLPNLTAGFAEGETRTYVESGKYLRWHEDDRLTSFYGNTLNRQYKFNGATGDNSGSFSYVSSGNLETGNALDCIYAVYPYDETITITDDGQISLTLPAVQTYAENSFGRGANTMLAVTENVEDTFLGFKNVCGYLKLKLYNAEGATIKSIEVKGNNGERLAGAATSTIAFGGAPRLAMADDATTAITLDCGDGVALGTTAEAATEFWVVIPETTFENGITITVTDTEGGIFEKSTTKEVVIERNAVQPMAALEVEFVVPVVLPANNEIWYTNGSTTEATTPYKTDVFGANIVSNTYDAEKGCWVIKFDGDVTEIGGDAFYNCKSLKSVTIPDSVTTIGDYAFESCTSLTSVNIPDSISWIATGVFAFCTSLTSVTIGDSVTEIETCAFESCTSLTSIIIPDSVTTIGWYAFGGCSSLQEFSGKFASEDGRCLVIKGVLNSFAPAGITGYTIPDSVTAIGDEAFYNCKSLKSVTIPASVTEVGASAFRGCSSLTSVTIGDSVTTIGDNAFKLCTSLESITIPDSVTSIDSWAFHDCSSLTSVYCKAKTPPTVRGIFSNNNISVINVYVPAESISAYRSASYWKDCAHINVIITPYDFEKGEVVEEIKSTNTQIWYTNGSTTNSTKPYKTDAFGANIVSNLYDADKECWVIQFDGDVTTIGDRAFYECGITNITIPESVTSIGSSAFSRCSSLTSVTIPDSVTTIGESAFSYCPSLTSMTLGKGVTAIGYSAFNECTGELIINCNIPSVDSTSGVFSGSKFTSVTIGDGVTSIGSTAFYSCSSLTSVTFSDSVTSIGKGAFCNCSSLTSVTIGNSVTSIGDWAFDGCSSLTSISIPYSVTTIGESAFNCLSLTSVKITDISAWCKIDFKTIASNPLNQKANLYLNSELVTELVIPSDITEIKPYAFYSCKSLTSVTIPESVTAIGNYAFRNCSSLTSVYCKAVTPPTGAAYMFNWYSDAPDLKIYVPAASVSAYKTGSWSSFKTQIVGYDF